MQATDFSDDQILGAIAASRAQGYSDADITSGALANFGVDVSKYLNPPAATDTAAATPVTGALTQAAATPAAVTTAATNGITADTPGAQPVYGGRDGSIFLRYEVPEAYRAEQAMAAQTAANLAAGPSAPGQIWVDQPSKADIAKGNVIPQPGRWVTPGPNDILGQIGNVTSTMSPIILGALSGGVLGAEGVLAGQVVGAGQAIQSGNVLGGLAQLAGAGGYTNVATGLNVAQAVSSGNAGALVTALVSNPSVAAVAGSTMLTDTISLSDAANAARVVAAANSGNISGVLSGASALTGSADLATAAAAVNLVTAAKSGNITGILNAATGLQGALTAANRVTDANVASTLVQNVGDFAAAGQDTSTTITNPNAVTGGGADAGATAYQAAIAAGATPDEALATANTVTGTGAVTDAQAQAAITASRDVFEGDEYNTRADAANAARLAGSNTFSYDGKTYGIDTWESDGRAAVSNVLDSVRQDQLASIATIPKFADAYTSARALLGPGQTFTWNGKSYSTATRAEDPALAAASDQARMDNLSISTTAGGGRGTTAWTSADTLGAVAAATNLNKVSAAAVDWSNAGDMFGGESTDAMGNAVNTAGSGADTTLSRSVNAAQDAIGGVVRSGLSNLAMAGGEQTAAIGGVLANMKLANADNILVQAGNAASNFGSSIESAESKKGTQNIVSAVSKADGVFGKLIAGISSGWDNPAAATNLIIREGLQEVLPIGIASKAAKIMSIGAAAGIDTAINAGEAMGGAYNDAYKAAIKAGMSAENADAFAGKVGLSAGGIALVTSGVMDAAVVKTLFRTETGSIASQLTKGSTKEGISENIEETATALATQYLTTGKIDFNSALTQGAIGHLIGKSTSGSVGAVDTGVQIGDANAAVTGSTAATGDTTTAAGTGNVVTGGTDSTAAGTGTEITAEAIGGAGKIDGDSDVATADDFSTILSSTGDASTAATTAVTNAVGSGANPGSAVAAVITAAADTGANTTAATGAAVTAAVGTAANTAASTGADASTAVTAATDAAVTAAVGTAVSTAASTGADTNAAVTSATDAAVTSAVTAATNTAASTNTSASTAASTATDAAVTAAVSTAATTATATGANTGSAVTSATDAAVTSAVAAAVDSGADVNTAATTAVTAAVTTAVDSGVDVDTATTAAVTAAVNAGVDTNTATTIATSAATDATTNTIVNANTGVDANTVVDANTTTSTDSNTGVVTTVTTNPDTNTTSTVTTNPDTTVTSTVTTNPNTDVTTNTVTNPDTNSTITLTLNTQTGVPTVTDSVGDVQVIDGSTVVIDGTPIDIATGEVLTEEQVQQRKTGVKTKATSPKITLPKTPTKKSSSPMLGYGASEPTYPYKDYSLEETWLGGTHPANNPTSALAALFAGNATMDPDMQAYSALRQATGVDNTPPTTSTDYYSYGTEPSYASVLQPYMRGGTVQNRAQGGKMMASPLMAASGGESYHKGSHYVQGAGGGQDDLIPAKLADGEYVFDAEIVAALGDGSNKEGAAKLDKWREAIRKHKRSGSINSIPPKAKSPLAYMKGI